MELKDTIDGMLSEDYKERFKAEYNQLSIRHKKLNDFIANWDNLGFTPTCPKELLEKQLKSMSEYLDVLKERAILENIEL